MEQNENSEVSLQDDTTQNMVYSSILTTELQF